MSKFTQDNHKNDEAWNPAVEFVQMYNLVAEKGDDEGAGSNDDDSCITRDATIDSVDQLRADNDIDSGPAKASQTIEQSD